jgi:Flp pilus assembly pilin Flp
VVGLLNVTLDGSIRLCLATMPSKSDLGGKKLSGVQNRKLGGTNSGAYRLVARPEYQYSNLFTRSPSKLKTTPSQERSVMLDLPLKLWRDEAGQDIAEYAVMLAVILVLVVGTIRLVGTNANNAFSSVASTIQ